MGSPSNFSAGARRQAAHILSQAPYTAKPPHLPDPLAGVLHTIGRWVTDWIGKPVAWVWDHLSHLFNHAFGSFTDAVLAILAIGLGGLLAWLLMRRRTRIGPRDTHDIQAPVQEDAAALEAAAAAAEASGDLDESVRLRFRAGLARLESAGIIASRLVTTTQQVRGTLQNPTFDHLAERHEAIAYAGRTASTGDAVNARENWPRVIEELRGPRKRQER